MKTSRADYYLNTRPIDRKEASRAAKAVYKFCKLDVPKVVFVDGPNKLKYELENIEKVELIDLDKFNDITTFYTQRGFGGTDTVERAIHTMLWKLVPCGRLLCTPKPWSFHEGKVNHKWTLKMIQLWEESYAFVATPDICYIMERPESVITSRHGLHNKLGPAVTFRDGTEIFAYNGIQLKEDYIKNPETVPLEVIHSTKHKHLLIDLVGLDRYFEMIKNWSPDVVGRMKKFFHFPRW